MARHSIVALIRGPLRDALDAYHWCDDSTGRAAWLAWVVRQVHQHADVLPGVEIGSYRAADRAYCPLCGRGRTAATRKALPFQWASIDTCSGRIEAGNAA